jgi:hypothetical protein
MRKITQGPAKGDDKFLFLETLSAQIQKLLGHGLNDIACMSVMHVLGPSLLLGLKDIKIRIVGPNRTEVNEMGMGENGAAESLVDILVTAKLFKRFLCNHQMGISSRHRRPTMLGFKLIEITI